MVREAIKKVIVGSAFGDALFEAAVLPISNRGLVGRCKQNELLLLANPNYPLVRMVESVIPPSKLK